MNYSHLYSIHFIHQIYNLYIKHDSFISLVVRYLDNHLMLIELMLHSHLTLKTLLPAIILHHIFK
jgi:hypothetical protein